MLDGDAWPALHSQAKKALLDRQLQYVEVKRDKTGEILWDDLQRPILRPRRPDRVVAFFHTVAGRHGASSIEVMQLRKIYTDQGQSYLPFIGEGGVSGDEDSAPESTLAKPLSVVYNIKNSDRFLSKLKKEAQK